MTAASPTERLATLVARLRFEELPEHVVGHAKLCLLDTLGCGLFGSTLQWTRIVDETVGSIDDTRVAGIWGSRAKTSIPNAALVNGTAVHAFELDDLHSESIVHPGSVVVSAALASAAGRRGCTGRELIVAMAAGYEVAARVGMAVGAAHLIQGWHPTGTHGALGAAAASGTLLRLSPEQMRDAIGIAGSLSSGLMASQFSSMVKRLHAGHAAQSGVMSALLARNGFTGIPDLLESPYGGYLSTFSPSSRPERLTERLGEDWQIAKAGFKPYSANGSCHPTIDAILEMRQRHGLVAEDVDRVEIECSTATVKHVGWRYRPESVTTAQMNLPYIVAVVLTDGDAFVDQFSPERIADPSLLELSRRVTVSADPEIDAGGDARRHATRVRVFLTDGRVLSDSREHATGSASRPLTRLEVEAKFFKLASRATDPAHAAELKELVMAIDDLDDLDDLDAALSFEPHP